MTRPPVELRIEELVLDGVPAGDRWVFAEALQRELGRLLTARGTPPELAAGSHPGLELGDVRLSRSAAPAHAATEVARALHRGLNGLGRGAQ